MMFISLPARSDRGPPSTYFTCEPPHKRLALHRFLGEIVQRQVLVLIHLEDAPMLLVWCQPRDRLPIVVHGVHRASYYSAFILGPNFRHPKSAGVFGALFNFKA